MQKSMFWADQIAARIIKERKKKKYILFGGTTPSGVVHSGNFRDTLTVYAVYLAMKDKGVNVECFQSWDDYDRFRKIPGNVPKEWKKYLGLPVSSVPDPWKCHKSYGEHFEKLYLKELDNMGVKCKHVFQTKMYKDLNYKELIKKSLLNREKIMVILNKFRTNSLPSDWQPVNIYCKKCKKDTTTLLDYDGNYIIKYSCECGFKGKIDFSKEGNIKLAYRVDWPMKWHYNKTDYEPVGKDLFTAGSVMETAQVIQKEVFGSKGPINTGYNQIMLKGQTTKMSSSKGNVVTLTDLLKVYTPEILRFLYLGTKPNKEFALSLDEDVLKIYEDFYWVERIYFKKEEVNERNQAKWSRVYELSQLDKIPKKLPKQPKFRYCIELINLCNHDVEKALEKVKELKGTNNLKRWKDVLERAKYWVENYAPDKYRFEIQEPKKMKLSKDEKAAVKGLIKIVSSKKKEEQLADEIFELAKDYPLGTKSFFKLAYRILIGKDMGPRLSTFLLAIGLSKVKKILQKV